ncbi:MAG: hypothetical protein H7841_07680 [Magnetospirillum sp. WYHS-4]
MGRLDPHPHLADVVQSAELLIREHGGDAALVAEMQAGARLQAGDMAGYRTWKRIELLVDSLSGGLAPHAPLHP